MPGSSLARWEITDLMSPKKYREGALGWTPGDVIKKKY